MSSQHRFVKSMSKNRNKVRRTNLISFFWLTFLIGCGNTVDVISNIAKHLTKGPRIVKYGLNGLAVQWIHNWLKKQPIQQLLSTGWPEGSSGILQYLVLGLFSQLIVKGMIISYTRNPQSTCSMCAPLWRNAISSMGNPGCLCEEEIPDRDRGFYLLLV